MADAEVGVPVDGDGTRAELTLHARGDFFCEGRPSLLAQALASASGQRARAAELAHSAREHFLRSGRYRSQEIAQVDAWLEQQQSVR